MGKVVEVVEVEVREGCGQNMMLRRKVVGALRDLRLEVEADTGLGVCEVEVDMGVVLDDVCVRLGLDSWERLMVLGVRAAGVIGLDGLFLVGR
jgi:hypothetical protein